jgi:hypothetical protein
MTTNQTAFTPATVSPAEKKIDAGIKRAYKTFGTDFDSFFAAVLADIVRRHESRTTQQDTRFIKAREPRP